MRVPAFLRAAVAAAVTVSPAIALAIGGDGNPAKGVALRDLGCSIDAIDACVTSTGQKSSACFGQLCAGRPIETVAKREDQCTEENLLQCAILDWNEAQACFQQLCL